MMYKYLYMNSSTIVNINDIINDIEVMLEKDDEAIDDYTYYAHFKMILILDGIRTSTSATSVPVSVLQIIWDKVLDNIEKEQEVDKSYDTVDYRRFMNLPNKVWIN